MPVGSGRRSGESAAEGKKLQAGQAAAVGEMRRRQGLLKAGAYAEVDALAPASAGVQVVEGSLLETEMDSASSAEYDAQLSTR